MVSAWPNVSLRLIMKRRCLPCHLIARNVCILLVAIAAGLITVVEIHAASNHQPSQKSVALKRLFAYQIMLNFD
jgi:hypothetical protein